MAYPEKRNMEKREESDLKHACENEEEPQVPEALEILEEIEIEELTVDGICGVY